MPHNPITLNRQLKGARSTCFPVLPLLAACDAMQPAGLPQIRPCFGTIAGSLEGKIASYLS